jgi:predicted Zn-dependent peptidase
MVKEKGIIKQEIDMYQDDPDYRLYAGALEGLFPDSPLAVDLAGTEESINQITYDDLLLAFQTFYCPEQMQVLLVGDLTIEDIEGILQNYRLANQVDKTVKLERMDLQLAPVKTRQTIRMDVAQSKLAVAFRPQEILKKDLFYGKIVLRLYANLLLGWTSTTYQDWYSQGLIDDTFEVQVEVNERYQFVMVTLDTGQPIAMSAKIKQLLKNPNKSKDVTEEHFLMVKKELYGEFFASLDHLDDLAVSYLEHDFDDGSYFDLPDLLFNLTLDEVCQVGQAFFAHSDAVDYTIFPK